ncbi:hypothetical protein NA56DRAFT_705508 [Hyaloscypha hepaticicola]|uniref:LysM domain-containing protein n=1 Tax=Hyaloscypha hepaticicola TaxID=2082293 RepID=A0A2J6Q0I8_9HELO|nr:hypothetical protein NA56DRAFT_705508 [Hyaloscypha hepaticicola]
MRVTGLLQVFLLLTLSALGLAASLPNGRPNPDGLTVRTAPERDYTIGKMGFKGLIGGHYFELNGTIQTGLFCWPVPGQPWGPTYHDDVTDSVQGIRSIYSNLCYFPPGPGVCAPLTCTANTQLMVCNDNNYEIVLECGATLGDMAQAINDNCNNNGLTGGQQFNALNYNLYTDWRNNC